MSNASLGVDREGIGVMCLKARPEHNRPMLNTKKFFI